MRIEMKLEGYKEDAQCFPQDIKHFMFNEGGLSIVKAKQTTDDIIFLTFSNEVRK